MPLQHRPPTRSQLRLPAVLFALSDPARLHIVKTLEARGETMCAAVGLSLAKSSCSRHFKVLREAGVIRTRRCGTAYLNSLRRDELDTRFPGLLDAVLGAVDSRGGVSR